jgi:hypothetical protein
VVVVTGGRLSRWLIPVLAALLVGAELVGTVGFLAARGSEPVVEVEAAPAPTPLPQAR